jgi:hypothetical protein
LERFHGIILGNYVRVGKWELVEGLGFCVQVRPEDKELVDRETRRLGEKEGGEMGGEHADFAAARGGKLRRRQFDSFSAADTVDSRAMLY